MMITHGIRLEQQLEIHMKIFPSHQPAALVVSPPLWSNIDENQAQHARLNIHITSSIMSAATSLWAQTATRLGLNERI